LERAQHVKAAGKRDNEAAIGRHFLAWTLHCLSLPPLMRTLVDNGRASK
jgi:hypothetical protein